MGPSKKGMASKPSRRTSVAPKPTARSQLLDLFQPFGIPPTPLHQVLQNTAIEAGWTPPWDGLVVKEKSQIARNQIAGKKSRQNAKGRADIRRLFVKAAYDNLNKTFKNEPWADQSLDELMKRYRFEITQTNDPVEQAKLARSLMSAAPFKASRETLKKDLMALGIRSNRRKKRSG